MKAQMDPDAIISVSMCVSSWTPHRLQEPLPASVCVFVGEKDNVVKLFERR